MATKKKMLQAAAGNAGGGSGGNVEDVFSTYLYEGNGSTQTITNGIDLDGEGGLVWLKQRTGAGLQHVLYDTERGSDSALFTALTNGAVTSGGTYTTTFNSGGFTTNTSGSNVNNSGEDNASWTFRKAPKFFTCLTYTGDGVNGRTVSHNLGSVPGCMIVKGTSSATNWYVYHTDTGNGFDLFLNSTIAKNPANTWYYTDPTSTEFTLSSTRANQNGVEYVAYLFAHNEGDGGFGADGDADIIKCGSYTGTALPGNEIDLGFEPQFLIRKAATRTSDWLIEDNMRGITDSYITWLKANDSAAEVNVALPGGGAVLTPTGFVVNNSGTGNISGDTYIYIAIRRGTKVPESGTEVFAIDAAENQDPRYTSGFPVDFALNKLADLTTDWTAAGRLNQGKILRTNTTAAEGNSTNLIFDYNTGWFAQNSADPDNYSWMWKRAPGFFDVVCYEWNGTATRNVEHNLGVPPEMYIVKRRNNINGWYVRHKDFFGTNGSIVLNTTAATAQTGIFTTGGTTDTTFPVANDGTVNASGGTYIAYLFATLDGISKVGSYTGNGSSQTINCGFTSGARFILIKRTDSTGDWYVWDTERGIVAGNDPHLSLNTTAAEVTTDDSIDPDSSGFIVNQVSATNINVSSAEYIFYAIA